MHKILMLTKEASPPLTRQSISLGYLLIVVSMEDFHFIALHSLFGEVRRLRRAWRERIRTSVENTACFVIPKNEESHMLLTLCDFSFFEMTQNKLNLMILNESQCEIVIFHKVLSAYRVLLGSAGSYNLQNLPRCLSQQ